MSKKFKKPFQPKDQDGPKLTYFPDGRRPSNFQEWQRSMLSKVTLSSEFQDFSTVVEHMKHKVFVEPSLPAELVDLTEQAALLEYQISWTDKAAHAASGTSASVSDTSGGTSTAASPPRIEDLVRELASVNLRRGHLLKVYEKSCERIADQKANYERSYESVMHLILTSMSLESKSVCESSVGWTKIYEEKDPLPLMRLISKTHRGVPSVSKPKEEVEIEMQGQLSALRQGESETVAEYKARFKDQVSMAEACLGSGAYTDGQLAVYFRKGLDQRRFAPFEVEYQNSQAFSPGTLIAAFDTYEKVASYVSTYRVVHPQKSESTSAAAYVVATEPKKKKKKKGQQQQPLEKDGKDEKLAKIKCFNCQKMGHYASDCPSPKSTAASVHCTVSEELRYPFLEWSNELVLMTSEGGSLSTEVLCDNECSQSIFGNKDLLEDIRRVRPLRFNGLGGGIEASQAGIFRPLGIEVYFSPRCPVNVLSWGSIAQDTTKFDCGFKQPDKFWIRPRDGGPEHTFSRRPDNLYTKDYGVFVTVAEKEAQYDAKDVRAAKRVIDFENRVGVPVPQGALEQLIQLSNNTIGIVPRHFKVARDIYGRYKIGELMGKSTEPSNSVKELEVVRRPLSKSVEVHSDLMYVCGEWYLLSVVTTLGLLITTHLGPVKGSRSSRRLSEAISGQVTVLSREGFSCRVIFLDGESGALQLVGSEDLVKSGVRVDCSPTSKVPKAERAIRFLKTWIRGMLASLWFKEGWKPPAYLCKDMVEFCTSRANMFASKRGMPGVPAIEALTGVKINLDTEFRAAFGDYAQVATPGINFKNDVTIPRTEAAIFLKNADRTGAGVFFTLQSKKRVVRRKFIILPKPVEVVARLVLLSSQTGTEGCDEEIQRAEQGAQGHEEGDFEELWERAGELPRFEAPTEAQRPPTPDAMADDDADVAEDPVDTFEPESLADEIIDEPEPVTMDEVESASIDPQPVEMERYPKRVNRIDYSALQGGQGKCPVAYGFNITVAKALQTDYEKAMASIREELLQLVETGTFQPLVWEDLSVKRQRKVLRSFMFLKNKYEGKRLIKLKARLVGDGSKQCREDFDPTQISSPTVNLMSLLMVMGIAAMERREVRTYDIKGAYLEAKMPEDSEVDIIVDAISSKVICSIRPEYSKFLRKDNTLCMNLKRALYGTLQAGKLWYDEITSFLKGQDFVVNPLDNCVWNKGSGSDQISVCIYVDDLAVTSKNSAMIDQLEGALKSQFTEVKVHVGKVHHYLAMLFDFSVDGELKISMQSYEEDCVGMMGTRGVSHTPATPDLFKVVEEDLADEDQQVFFHSMVAKLLFLAKRTRPDILLPVSFLTTRVNKATRSDMEKLFRIGRYLSGSHGLGIRMSFAFDSIPELMAFIDAAYGVHTDRKSQSGIVISLGGGPVYVSCAKQKLMTKSSHEAELVSLSDGGSQVIWSRNFVIAQGYDLPPVKIGQDNQAVIHSIQRGVPAERSRHVDIRYFWLKDRAESGEVLIEYVPTEDMVADLLTKPLQGEIFRRLRDLLLNWVN